MKLAELRVIALCESADDVDSKRMCEQDEKLRKALDRTGRKGIKVETRKIDEKDVPKDILEKAKKTESKNESIVNLRAIALGWDESLVEAVGGAYLMNEGAILQSIKLKMSDTMKSAKQHMKNAKNASGKEAIREYDAAIKDLKDLQKQAEEIEDDHAIMIFLDSFIKAFIPIFAGTLAGMLTGVAAFELIGIIGGYVCGMSKSMDYMAAVEKGLTGANKQGKGGKPDPTTWWKIGESRGAVMTKLDRMITACEQGKDKIKD